MSDDKTEKPVPVATTYTKDYDGEFGERGKLVNVTIRGENGEAVNVPQDLLRVMISDVMFDALVRESFPGANPSIEWSVSLPDDLDTDDIEDQLFQINGIEELFVGNPACGPYVSFSVQMKELASNQFEEISKELAEVVSSANQASQEEEE